MCLRTLSAVAALAALRIGVSAETLTVELPANAAVETTIDSPIDDSNLRDPRGYRHHGSAKRVFQRQLTLTNTGTTPLTGQLIINNADWSGPAALRASFPPKAPPSDWLPRLFHVWCHRVSHADSDAPGGKEPFALLNFWGYALCGDTTAAFTHFAASQGVPARKIPLNGHVAAEYFYDDAWHIFDTDQNVVYLKLDNRTLASAADLRADPFLARRTKVFGRYGPMNLAAAAFNTSLHEFIEAKDGKPVVHKKPPASVRADTLYPGEKMIVYGDQPPDKAIGQTDLAQWGSVREDTLCLVEFTIDPKARPSANPGEVTFDSGFPILRAVNHTTGDESVAPPGEPTFAITIKTRAVTDRVSVYCQRARATLPLLQKGRNTLRLAAPDSKGKATLVADLAPGSKNLQLPAVTAALIDGTPTFAVRGAEGTDFIWWQVAHENTFDFIPPNFDAVIRTTDRMAFDPLTATFLTPGHPSFIRIKGRRNGIWGDWSAPLEFRIAKPTRPAPAQATFAGNRMRLSWPPGGNGCDYLVFGSNRLDFLPEPFATDEIVRMRDQAIEEKRPNKNLVATTDKPHIDFEPTFRFYRVIARRGEVLSVPGDLIVTPAPLAAKLPPGMVLQDRWLKTKDPTRPGAEVDQHIATEVALP
jgi:hypothetical protein